MMPGQKTTDSSEVSEIEREVWSAEKISNESANQMPDEIVRQVLRGDESLSNADERDIVGGSLSIDTPQGREEAKTKQDKN